MGPGRWTKYLIRGDINFPGHSTALVTPRREYDDASPLRVVGPMEFHNSWNRRRSPGQGDGSPRNRPRGVSINVIGSRCETNSLARNSRDVPARGNYSIRFRSCRARRPLCRRRFESFFSQPVGISHISKADFIGTFNIGIFDSIVTPNAAVFNSTVAVDIAVYNFIRVSIPSEDRAGLCSRSIVIELYFFHLTSRRLGISVDPNESIRSN